MNVIKALIDQVRLTWRLLRDPRVPFYLKAVPFIGFLYVISPIDFIPDVIIGLGQLDDIGIILAGMRMFEALTPSFIVDEHRDAIRRFNQSGKQPPEVIEGRGYRVQDKAKRG
jgi:uncharacterized membrane protein YkvA (DUF1232 family)